MPTTEAILASPRASNVDLLKSVQNAIPHTCDMQDIEMISLLTSIDDHSARTRSRSPIRIDEMSNSNHNSFQSARERGNTNGGNGNNGSYTSMGPSSGHGNSRNGGDSSALCPRNGSSRAECPLSEVEPGHAWPEQSQLDVAYGYCIQRNDGSYTRLVPADDLHRTTYPEHEGPQGLIVLPIPRLGSPRSRGAGADPMVDPQVVDQLMRIRQGRPRAGSRIESGDNTQRTIDSIIATSPPAMGNGRMCLPPRREKIYCDKWIHEGVCAFTQMGCKYKHVMPTDKATQMSLGLNHGFPSWYRRAYPVPPFSPGSQAPAALAPTMPSPPPNPNRLSGPWRRQDARPSIDGSSAQNGQYSYNSGNGNSFGAIGQPPQYNHQAGFISNNPYSMLDGGNGSQNSRSPKYEDEDDQVTYQPRYR